jgi:L-amino acid N-acyltransferase YncA
MSITVRSATEADIPQITDIYAHHVLHGVASFEEIPPTPDDMRQRMRDIANRHLPYLVAEQAGIILGYAYAAPYKLDPSSIRSAQFLRSCVEKRRVYLKCADLSFPI